MAWRGVLFLQLHQLNFKHYGIPGSLPWAVRPTPLHSARLVPNHFLWDRVVVLLLVLSEIVCRISSSSQRPYTSVHCFPCYKKHLDTQTPYKSHIYGIHNKRSWQCTGHYKLNEETVTLTDKMQLSIFYEPPVMFFHEISVILKKNQISKTAKSLWIILKQNCGFYDQSQIETGPKHIQHIQIEWGVLSTLPETLPLFCR